MEEREQKTMAQATDHPKGERLEAEGLSGVQTFMEITEDKLVEVQIDEQHLLELIVSPYNISRAIRKVMSNGGSGGVDGMSVKDLPKYWELRGTELKELILTGKYKPAPVRRVEIPKDNGKTRKLGIPTAVDRVIQQAIAQVLGPMYEPQFSEGSFGFRPGRSAHDALRRAQDTTFSFSSQSLPDYAAMKQELYHLGTREYGIELRCENIFVKDDVLFLLICLKNESAMSYGLGTVAPSSEGRFVFTFDKIALVKGHTIFCQIFGLLTIYSHLCN